MKKAKIMLLSVAILAIVGGALAFKAKTYSIEYCYTTQTTTNGSPSNKFECPLVALSKVPIGTPTQFFYATTKNGACPAKCPPLTLIPE